MKFSGTCPLRLYYLIVVLNFWSANMTRDSSNCRNRSWVNKFKTGDMSKIKIIKKKRKYTYLYMIYNIHTHKTD